MEANENSKYLFRITPKRLRHGDTSSAAVR